MYVGCVIYFIVLVLVPDFYSIFTLFLIRGGTRVGLKCEELDCDWKINVKMISNIFIYSVCCGIDGGYGGQVVAGAYWV